MQEQRTDDAQATHGSSKVVGKIMGTKGEVVVVAADGSKSSAGAGREVRLNEKVLTEGGSAAVIQIEELKTISLGHDSSIKLDEELLLSLKDLELESSIADGVNFDAIEQSLDAGISLEDILPAPAAGGDDVPTAAGSAGVDASRLERTATQVTPESGFDTSAFQVGYQDISFSTDNYTYDFLLTQQNSSPEFLPITNANIDQGQPWSMNLFDFVRDQNTQQSLSLTVENLPEGLVFDPVTGILSGTATNAAALGNGGEYVVTLTANDNSGASNSSATGSFTLTINNVNDLPEISSPINFGAIDEDGSLLISREQLLSGATDIDGDVLDVSLMQILNGNGQVVQNANGDYVFTPSANWNGQVQFTYTIADGQGGEVTNAASLAVRAVNDAPTAVSDGVIGTEVNTPVTLDVLANDFDIDGDNIVLVNANANRGTITLNTDGTITYTPASDYIGRDMISYTIADEHGVESTSLALVNIIVGNTPPELGDDQTINVAENSTVVGTFAATDPQGDNVSYSLEGDDASLFQIDNAGNLNFINPPDFEANSGPFNVTIVATDDGIGNLSGRQNLTVNVTDVDETVPNTAPVLGADTTVDVEENTVFVGNYAGSDADGDALSYSVNNPDFTIDAFGNLSFAAAPDYESNPGPYSVIITATDERGLSTTQTLTLNVVNSNESPTVSSSMSVSVSENDAGYSLDLLAGANDPDSSDTLSVSNLTLTGGDASGITINGNSLDVDPSAYNSLAVGESVVVEYSYDIVDGNGGSVAQTATITITGTNDAPSIATTVTSIASEDNSAYSVDLLAGASDPDASDSLSVSNLTLTSGDASGVTINGNSLDIDPSAYNNLAVGESAVIEYSYDVVDGNGGSVAQVVTITIAGANDAPSVSSAVVSSASEDDASYSVDLLAGANDPDSSDTLSVANLTVNSGDASGIVLNGNNLDVDPSAYNSLAVGESVVIEYSYDVADGNGGSVAQTATVTITGTNDAPSISSAVVSSASEDDASYSVDLLAGASDPDSSDSLSVANLTLNSGDTSGVTINGNSLDVDPSAYNSLAVGESVVIEYSYDIVDGNGGSVAQTATITIAGTNDAPSVSSAVVSSASEDDAAYSVDLLAGASDPDSSDSLSVSNLTLTSGDASGVTVNSNSLDVDPSAYNNLAVGETVVIEYSYDVVDGNGGSVAQTATITITGVNDAPSVSSAVVSSASEDGASYSVDLLAGANDPDSSDTLSVANLTLNSGDASGVTVNGNSLDVDPSAYDSLAVGESTVIEYSYDIVDGNGGSVAQTATITITGANDAPSVSSAVTSAASEDDASYSVDLLAGASDPDASDSLSVSNLTLTSGDASGVTINGNSLDVDPSAYNSLAVGESVVIEYSYDVVDGNGGSVAQAATITIIGTNDAPSVSTAVASTASEGDASYFVDLLAGASDPDTSDLLSVSNLTLTNGDASGITVNGNGLDVDPSAYNSLAVGESIVIEYSYDVVDGNGGSFAQTATITITGSNDAPSVSSAVVSSVSEDDASYSVDLLAGASDPDASDSLSVSNLTLISGDASGISVNGNNLDVDPSTYNSLAAGESVVIEYSYDVVDGNGGSVAQSATIAITGTNDEPSVSSAVVFSASEDDASYSVDLLAGANDPDSSDTLSVANLTLNSGDASGVTINGNSLDVDPSAYNSLAVGESVVIEYSYDVVDGNGGIVAQTATITTIGTNDDPSVSGTVTSDVTENTAAYSLDLLGGASDADTSDVLSVSGLTLVSGDASGITINGNFLDIDPSVYTSLADGQAETIIYEYQIDDGNGGTVSQTATITITGGNGDPVVSSAVISSASEDDASYSVDLLAGASDPDASDSLSVSNLTLTNGDASGVTINGNSLGVDPSAYNSLAVGETVVIEYSYDVVDGNGGSVAQTATITIAGGNDTPSVSTAVTSTASEDDMAYSVDLLSGAGDPDTSDSLSVSNLTLISGDASGITVNGNSLDVDPSAYNSLAIGESVVIEYSYDVVDGNGGTVAQTATVTITGANDAPSVSSAVTSSASEDDASFSVDLLVGASDPDTNDSLSVSNLTLTSGDASGITVNGNSLDVDPSAYNSLAVGESVVIEYSYDIVDGNGGSVAQTATITIAGTNDTPSVSSAVVSSAGEDDTAYSVDLLAGASDPDASDSLSVFNLTLISGDASGVTVNGNSLDVDPSAYNDLAVGETVVIEYSYYVIDGNGGSVAQAATVTITGTNDAPSVATAVTSAASEDDAAYSVDLLASASDPDASDSLSVSNLTLTSGDASGVAVNGSSLDIDPSTYNSLAVGESVVIEYSYDVVDGNGGSVAQTATITITGANDVPSVSSAVTSAASEDAASYSIDLLAGASDPDASNSLSVSTLTLTSGDASGISVNGNNLDVDPSVYNSLANGESVVIEYSYDVVDGNGGSVAQTATITITGTNDAPSVSSAVVSSASEDDTSYFVNLLTGANDPDSSDTLSVANLTLNSGDASGVAINGNSLNVDPSAYNNLAVGETVVIEYSYDVVDGNGGTVAQTAMITITGTNDNPSVSGTVTSEVTENTAAYSLDLLAGANDADTSDVLSVGGLTLVSGDASGITINGNFLDIDPSVYTSLADGQTETIIYEYLIDDGNGGTVSQTATITITGGNGDPVVSSAVTSSASEDDSSYSVDLLAGASDPDSSDSLSVSNLTLVSGDASGVTVNGNSLDVDPSAYNSLAVGETVVIEYSYDVVDGNGGSVAQTATITITGANDVPSVSSAVTSTASEDDASYSVDLLAGASDPDASDSLSVSNLTLTNGDASGVTINGNSLDVDPSAYNSLAVGESVVIEYSYDVVDGNGGAVAQTATITITGSNDAPSVSSAVVSSVSEDDAGYSVDLLAGAIDPDSNDSLSVSNLTLISGDASGITVNGNSLDIDPSVYNNLAVGETVVIEYSYDVVDGNGGSVAQTATITIAGANDVPSVSSAVTSTALEDDASYSVDLLAGASDPDSSDSLSISNLTLTSGDASGITVNGNSLDVDPSAYNSLAVGESVVVEYSYDVVDGNGGSVTQTATITIAGANDAPSISSAVVSSVSEDNSAYSVDLLAGTSDPDSSDTLSVANLTLISGDASGVTLNGSSLDVDPSAYNSLAVGESVVIEYSYDVVDGSGGSVAQTATITIIGTNDNPSVSGTVTSDVTENTATYSLDLLAGASDADASDVLSVSGLTLVSGDASGITINGNFLDIDPSVYTSLADGQTETIIYEYLIDDGNGGTVSQTATINITGGNGDPVVSSAVTSSASEDDASYSVDLLESASDPDSSDSLSVSNLALINGDASGVAVNGNSLDVDPSAYNGLAVGESVVIEYSYDIIDGNGGSVAQTATVTITGANDAPSVSSAVTSTASEDDSTYSVDLLADASDPDTNDLLSVSNLTLISGDASGITVNGNSLDVDPSAYNSLAVGESVVVEYSYDVVDGNGGSVAQTATITITGTNDVPSVVTSVTSTASEDDAAYSVDLLASASDPDASDSLSVFNVTLTSGDASGITVNGNSLDIDPSAYNNLAADETVVIEYSYDVVDGNGGSVAQIATVTITGTNDAPSVVTAVTSAASEDDATYSVDLLAGASDPDTSDSLSVSNLTLTSGDASGVRINGNSLDIDPSAYNSLAVGETAVIEYSYDVVDGNGGSVAQTATITITGTNDEPSVSSAVVSSASEDDISYSVDLLAGASDPDTSDSLSVSNLTLISGDASGVTLNGSSLDVDPSAYNNLAVGESAVIEYSYDVVDGNGGSVAQTAIVTVTGANDAPSVSSAVISSASEDDAVYSVDLLAGASDPDSSDSLSVSNLALTGGDASGFTVNGNSLDVDPSAYNSLAVGESVVVEYSYDVVDGNGGTVARTATITITGTNDTPSVATAVTSTASEDAAVYSVDLLAGASDPDTSDSLSVSNLTLTSGDASGVTMNGNSLNVDPSAYNSLAVGETVVVAYSYDVVDGNGGTVAQTATITITGTNDAPSVATLVTSTASEDDASYSIDLLAGASDPDSSDTLSVANLTLNSGDASGVTVNGNSLDIDPSAYNNLAVGESIVIEYSYDIVDGNGGTVAQTATITITGTNDTPSVSSAVASSASEDAAAYSVDLLAGASDPDTSDLLSVSNLTLTSGDASGITINGNSLEVDPSTYNSLAVGESVVIEYNYDVVDGNGGIVAQTATITITGTNDAPSVVTVVTSIASEDDSAYSVDLLAGASDPDASDSLSVSNLNLTGGDASGVAVNGNSLDVDPSAYNSLAVGETVVIEYNYDVVDGNGGSVAQTATITITGANDAPSVSSVVVSSSSEDDASYSVDLLAGANDPDSTDMLSVSNLTLISGDASGVTINGNSLDVDPSAYNSLAVGETVVVAYSYDVVDGNGGTVAQTATITITGTNDAPSVLSAVASSASEDAAAYSVDLLAGASDPDSSDSLSVSSLTLISGDASGISVNGNSLNIDPSAYNSLTVGETAVIEYSYDVVDGNGGSVAQIATITITGANDAPSVSSAVASSANEDDASYSVDLLAGASDPDASDSLSVSNLTLIGGDASGVTINGNSLDVDPSAYNNLAVGESVVIEYSYDIVDGNGGSVAQSATITINGSNDTPVISSSIGLGNINEDGSILITQAALLNGASDPDAGTTLSAINLSINSGNGALTDNGNGTWTFTPTANWSGDIAFDYQVSDGLASVSNTAQLTVDAVADAPDITFDSEVIDVNQVNEIPPPPSTGLFFSFYDELNNTDRTAALQEGVIDPANATSTSREINGFGTPKVVTNTSVVQNDGSTVEIDTGDSYSVTGLIYLEAGNTYQFVGYHDDSLRIELGGQTMVSTSDDSWGNYGPGTTVPGNVFTATQSGYYTIEAFVNNVSGIGQFSLNLSVNGGAAQILNGSNFNIYSSLTDLAAVGGQFGNFVASTDNTDGGYFPQVINAGLVDTYIEISNITANLVDLDGSESLQSIVLSNIPVDATLTDGTNTFTATVGSTQVDLLAQGWDLNNIKILPPSGFSGDIQLDVSATSVESSNGDTVGTTQSVTVTVQDIDGSAGSVDDDVLGASGVKYGTSGNDILDAADSQIQFNANSNNVLNDNDAFAFSFANIETGISSISIRLLNGDWDPGTGGGSYGVVVGAQSSGLSLTAGNFSTSNGNTVLNIDLSSQNLVDGSSFAFGVDFDNVSGGSNQAGVLANNAVVTVTLDDGRTQTVTVNNAGDTSNFTAAANLQFTSDVILGEEGNDTITVDAGDQLVIGGEGNDTINLGAGNDAAQGGSGNDYINGGNGEDILSGGEGIDTILGGAGDDIIFGDAGSDTLTGGSGRDIFVWRDQDDDGSTDTITDFQLGSAGDVLHFADVLEGESATAASLDNYFNFSSNGGNTTITIDSDGTGGDADLTVVLQGVDLVALYGNDQAILQQLLTNNNLQTD